MIKMVARFATLEEAKQYFDIQDEDIDELLDYLINHYSEVIIDRTGAVTSTIKTKEALFYAIGCHLAKTKMDKIYPTLAYTVGDVKERLQAPASSEESWCQLYQMALSDLMETEAGKFGIAGVKRKGLSDLREFR